MGSMYDEADPINLCRAICIVYDRWQRAGRKPASDNTVHATRTSRPALVKEVEEEWTRISGCDVRDDLFPYHESYVVRKWVQFRKQNDAVKAAWIAAAKCDE